MGRATSAMSNPVGEPPAGAPPAGAPPPAEGDETSKLNQELGFLRGEHQHLKMQIHQLEHLNHLMRVAPNPNPVHNPDWSQHRNPDDGSLYYFNKTTNESVWDKPADFNPQLINRANANSKGPRGANLFVVRKLRRDEYDSFADADLRTAFEKFGTVLRCEMTTDPATGWSKGFGFVSFTEPEAADAALASMHNAWVEGKQMRIEKTKADE